MRRLIRRSSRRFYTRINDYTYPELRLERPRVTGRSAWIEVSRERSGLDRKGNADVRR